MNERLTDKLWSLVLVPVCLSVIGTLWAGQEQDGFEVQVTDGEWEVAHHRYQKCERGLELPTSGRARMSGKPLALGAARLALAADRLCL